MVEWAWEGGKLHRGGVPLTDRELIRLRDELTDRAVARATGLAERFSAGKITLPQFQERLFALTKNTTIGQYALGRGGESALTAVDRAQLARLVGTQADYLRGFVGEVGTGGMTAEQIATRAAMYPESAIEAHSRGQAAARGIDLPVSPPAHPRCRCRIDYAGEGDAQTWSWVTVEDACPICAALAGSYEKVAA